MARGRHDEVYSTGSRFDQDFGVESDDWFGLLLRSPFLLLLLVEIGCVALLALASPTEIAASLGEGRWWSVVMPGAVVITSAASRFLFFRGRAPLWLRALLSLLSVAVLIYVVFLR